MIRSQLSTLRWHWRVFDNPHWYAGALVAMLATNGATLLWAILILLNDDVLESAGARYAWIVRIVPENVFAALLGGGSIVQIVWLLLYLPPLRFGHVGYAILCMWWLFVCGNIFWRPLFPTAASLSATVAVLAWLAFWSRSKPTGGADGMAGKG